MIILEGLDKCGKSTFANLLKLQIPDIEVIHFDKNSKMMQTMLNWDMSKQVIFDRSFISEICYGPVYRNKCKYTVPQIMQAFEFLRNKNAVIMYFKRDMCTVEFNTADEFEANFNHLKKVKDNYEVCMQIAKAYKIPVYEVEYL